MIRRPPRSTLDRSSAASDVYKRQVANHTGELRVEDAAVRIAHDVHAHDGILGVAQDALCLLYTSPSPRDRTRSRMPSSA